MDNGQGRGPIAVGRFYPQHGGLHFDKLAGLQVAQAARAFPLAGFIDGRHGSVAQLGPGFGGVIVVQICARYLNFLCQSQHPPAGRIQIERLAMRSGQANKIVDALGHGHKLSESRMSEAEEFVDNSSLQPPILIIGHD